MTIGTMEIADAELIERFKGGEVSAFENFYARYRKPLYGYALSLCRQREWAADSLQAAWLSFLQSVDNLGPESNFKAYLFRCLRNGVFDDLRRRGRELKALSEAAEGPVYVKATDGVARQESTEELNRALDSLPPEQREVILLRFFGDLTFSEVGKLLEVSPRTAESRHRLALEKLRSKMAGGS